ncbi:MAG: phosphonate ABC transporter ATP-binding protein [Alphaproteobacteria bacterium]|nr:phosphonate ABC transporter ATP-binding protein [Alphaproteobacteria bacterium]
MNIEADQTTMVEVRNLTKAYGSSAPAIEDISLSFKKGEFIVLLGPSGVGKSTLLRCLNFLVRPTSGIVKINGQELGALSKKGLLQARHHIGMIFQEFNLVNRMSVLMNVMCGRLGTLGTWRALTYNFSPEDHEAAVRALVRAGLEDQELYLRRADTLSGGQKQRVAIARMLIQEPKVILADEPIASLDVMMRAQIMDLIKDIAQRDGLTVVMSLHQLDVAKNYADRIIALAQGQVTFDGPPNELTDAVIERVFNKPADEIDEEQTVEITEAPAE